MTCSPLMRKCVLKSDMHYQSVRNTGPIRFDHGANSPYIRVRPAVSSELNGRQFGDSWPVFFCTDFDRLAATSPHHTRPFACGLCSSVNLLAFGGPRRFRVKPTPSIGLRARAGRARNARRVRGGIHPVRPRHWLGQAYRRSAAVRRGTARTRCPAPSRNRPPTAR